jgi:hypothetical protein
MTVFEMSIRDMIHEMDYLRKRIKEQEAVIAQLHRGFPEPGKPVYIHPADFSVLMEEQMKATDFMTLTSVESIPMHPTIGGHQVHSIYRDAKDYR